MRTFSAPRDKSPGAGISAHPGRLARMQDGRISFGGKSFRVDRLFCSGYSLRTTGSSLLIPQAERERTALP